MSESASVRFVLPNDLPDDTFAAREKAANTARQTFFDQFCLASGVAKQRGLELPLALLVAWHRESHYALFAPSTCLFETAADLRALGEQISQIDRMTDKWNLGTLLDDCTEAIRFFECAEPLPRPPSWTWGVPHRLDVPVLYEEASRASEKPTEGSHPAWVRLPLVTVLERLSFLLRSPTTDDAGWDWLQRLSYDDGTGESGLGGPRLRGGAPGGGVRKHLYKPCDAVLWDLDDPELPGWRLRVRELARAAVAEFVRCNAPVRPLPAKLRGPFLAIAGALFDRANAIEEHERAGRAGAARVQDAEVKSECSPPQRSAAADIPAEKTVHRSIDAPPHPDGPEAARWLWWEGRRHDLPSGNVGRLIAHMWAREYAYFGDLTSHEVFESDVSPQSFRGRASEASRVLKKIGVPWRLSVDTRDEVIRKESVNTD